MTNQAGAGSSTLSAPPLIIVQGGPMHPADTLSRIGGRPTNAGVTPPRRYRFPRSGLAFQAAVLGRLGLDKKIAIRLGAGEGCKYVLVQMARSALLR